jgi:hypothetical protein
VKGHRGLGNRLLGVLSGLLYADVSGRRLVVDWSDPGYSSDGENVFHRWIECRRCDPRDRIPSTASVWPPAWRSRLHEPAEAMARRLRPGRDPGGAWSRRLVRALSTDVAEVDHREEVVVLSLNANQIDELRRHFRGPFLGLRRAGTDAILRRLVRSEIRPGRPVREGVEAFAATHLREPTLGVHVRYTDKRGHLAGIERAVDAALAREPGLQVFLATDSLEIQARFVARYPRVVFQGMPRAPDGRPIHRAAGGPDREAGGLAALVDLYLVARCARVVVDEDSTFGYLARLLTDAPPTHVVNVQRTRRLGRAYRSLVPLAVRTTLHPLVRPVRELLKRM